MKLPKTAVDRVLDLMADAELGDKRRTKRLLHVMAKLAKTPTATLPAALGSDAEVQAAYRLINNDDVKFDAVLAPHMEATIQRATKARSVLVLHDTTDCSFPTLDPEEIGYLNTGKAGFRLHLSLVVDAETWRRPLGIIHAESLLRTKRSRVQSKRKLSGKETAARADREFGRWWRGMKAGAARLTPRCEVVIHIADREGDSYELMSQLLEAKQRFIIRVRVDRRGRKAGTPADDSWSSVREIAAGCDGVLERQVPLSRRKATGMPAADKAHPPRKMRLAKLRFAATTVIIPRPQYLRDPVPRELKLNLVHVFEVDPPPDQRPVEWLLYTTEPVDTPGTGCRHRRQIQDAVGHRGVQLGAQDRLRL